MESKTVLIVEDDPASLDIFETILRHGGYEVVTAQSGAEGLERARDCCRTRWWWTSACRTGPASACWTS